MVHIKILNHSTFFHSDTVDFLDFHDFLKKLQTILILNDINILKPIVKTFRRILYMAPLVLTYCGVIV